MTKPISVVITILAGLGLWMFVTDASLESASDFGAAIFIATGVIGGIIGINRVKPPQKPDQSSMEDTE